MATETMTDRGPQIRERQKDKLPTNDLHEKGTSKGSAGLCSSAFPTREAIVEAPRHRKQHV